MKHEDFESKLIKMLLYGEDEVLIKQNKQYGIAKISSRDFSDVGFYTTFSVPQSDDLCINTKSFYIGDVDGMIDGIEGAIGFLLFVKNGYISQLEGYTNVIDKWPESLDAIALSYDSGDKRNISRLKEKWT
jgi:hypothetical protein